jgi:hypothetical protein
MRDLLQRTAWDVARRAAASGKRRCSAASGRAVVSRANAYFTNGHLGAAPCEDASNPVRPQAEFAALLHSLGFLKLQLPRFTEYWQCYPRLDDPDAVRFLPVLVNQNAGHEADHERDARERDARRRSGRISSAHRLEAGVRDALQADGRSP